MIPHSFWRKNHFRKLHMESGRLFMHVWKHIIKPERKSIKYMLNSGYHGFMVRMSLQQKCTIRLLAGVMMELNQWV